MLFILAEQALDHAHRDMFLKGKPGQSHSSTTEIIILQSTAIQNNLKEMWHLVRKPLKTMKFSIPTEN